MKVQDDKICGGRERIILTEMDNARPKRPRCFLFFSGNPRQSVIKKSERTFIEAIQKVQSPKDMHAAVRGICSHR
ncbi:hypothetical protein HJC23_000915 [Cyclotella cryptica]|uniref:Uncharacterized protein n=1 Tax=Cyclotella cryptica TaxID=29204 RepID=A0ABD3QM33_9STRA